MTAELHRLIEKLTDLVDKLSKRVTIVEVQSEAVEKTLDRLLPLADRFNHLETEHKLRLENLEKDVEAIEEETEKRDDTKDSTRIATIFLIATSVVNVLCTSIGVFLAYALQHGKS